MLRASVSSSVQFIIQLYSQVVVGVYYVHTLSFYDVIMVLLKSTISLVLVVLRSR